MRTLIIILGGFVLLAACIGVARLASANAAAPALAITIFIVIWFLVAATNMWFGVARAGYSFTEELPIFLLIFLVPVAAAAMLKWKLL